MFDRYYKAHDCPNCGAKDNGDWGGARMMSSSWGHDFACCCDECGEAFGKIHYEKVKTKAGRAWLSNLWRRLENQSDCRLVGEPYYGYNAEQLVKSLGY